MTPLEKELQRDKHAVTGTKLSRELHARMWAAIGLRMAVLNDGASDSVALMIASLHFRVSQLEADSRWGLWGLL